MYEKHVHAVEFEPTDCDNMTDEEFRDYLHAQSMSGLPSNEYVHAQVFNYPPAWANFLLDFCAFVGSVGLAAAIMWVFVAWFTQHT